MCKCPAEGLVNLITIIFELICIIREVDSILMECILRKVCSPKHSATRTDKLHPQRAKQYLSGAA